MEVLVSLTIFAIASALMTPAFIYHLKTNTASEDRNGAIAVAQQVLDELRTTDTLSMPESGTTTQTISNQHRNYAVSTTYCADDTYCTTSSRHITIGVAYRGKTIHTVETVYTKLK